MWKSPYDDQKIIAMENKPLFSIGNKELLPIKQYQTPGKFAAMQLINEQTCSIIDDCLSSIENNNKHYIEIVEQVTDNLRQNKGEKIHIYAYDASGKLCPLTTSDECVFPLDSLDVRKLKQSILLSKPLLDKKIINHKTGPIAKRYYRQRNKPY